MWSQFWELVLKPWNVSLDPKFVSLPEEIAYKIISLALSVNEKDHQIPVSEIVPWGDRFSKKSKDVNNFLEVQWKDNNRDFISHKDINPRSRLNIDVQHPSRKGQYMKGNNFSTSINNFYFWNLIPTTLTGMSEDRISIT